jgi:hypothetical protein
MKYSAPYPCWQTLWRTLRYKPKELDAATNQEITEKTSYENISSEKMAGQAWSQDALKLVRINGIGISFDNTSYETYGNDYQLVVKDEEGATLALCIVEVYDDTQE